jgi:hypothetical protein
MQRSVKTLYPPPPAHPVRDRLSVDLVFTLTAAKNGQSYGRIWIYFVFLFVLNARLPGTASKLKIWHPILQNGRSYRHAIGTNHRLVGLFDGNFGGASRCFGNISRKSLHQNVPFLDSLHRQRHFKTLFYSATYLTGGMFGGERQQEMMRWQETIESRWTRYTYEEFGSKTLCISIFVYLIKMHYKNFRFWLITYRAIRLKLRQDHHSVL